MTVASLALLTACAGQDTALGDGEVSDAQEPTSAQVEQALADLYVGMEGTPPADGPPVAEDKSVYLVSCGEAWPACSVMGEEMGEAAKELGWDFKVLDGAGNAGGAYGNSIRQAVASGADAVVINGFDCSVVKQPLQEAKDAGVLVLGLEAMDCDETGDGEPLFTAPMQYLEGEVGMTKIWEAFGASAARYIATVRPDAKIIAASTWDDGTGTMVYEAFESTLAETCADCEIVEKVSGTVADAVPGGPLEQRFNTALVRHPDVTVVYALWESMLDSNMNGAKAVADAGLRDQTLLVGGLGTESAIDMLRDGTLDAVPHTVDKAWLAWGALDQLNRAFAGEAPAGGVGGPRLLDNTQDLPDSGSYRTDIDYVGAYKSIWKN